MSPSASDQHSAGPFLTFSDKGQPDDSHRPVRPAPKRRSMGHSPAFRRYAPSRGCGKDGDYWDSAVEMSARAFACYVMDKLQPQRSDYLCGHAECAINMAINKDGTAELIKAFPQSEERKAINAVFDELIAELKREQLLTHVESVPLFQQKEAALALAAPQGKQLSMFSEEKPSIQEELAAAAKQIKPKTAAHKAPNSRSQNARESGPMK